MTIYTLTLGCSSVIKQQSSPGNGPCFRKPLWGPFGPVDCVGLSEGTWDRVRPSACEAAETWWQNVITGLDWERACCKFVNQKIMLSVLVWSVTRPWHRVATPGSLCGNHNSQEGWSWSFLAAASSFVQGLWCLVSRRWAESISRAWIWIMVTYEVQRTHQVCCWGDLWPSESSLERPATGVSPGPHATTRRGALLDHGFFL